MAAPRITKLDAAHGGEPARIRMSTRRCYVVACLAGNGIGPEVMAEASRALAEISALHGFQIDEMHLPFGPETMTRSGHPLPVSTRQATLGSDAVLVAGSSQPALEGVKAGLDLTASVVRAQLANGGDLTVFAPLEEGAEDWTIERAFTSAKARTGRLTSVGVDGVWRARVERHAETHDVVDVRHLTLAEALHELATSPGSLGVVVAERVLVDAFVEVAGLRQGGRHPTATGLLSASGPGLFGPTHGSAHDSAGEGVANPSEMLLATALLLEEGIGRRAAAETLEESVATALQRSGGTPDVATGVGLAAGTREFVDVVLGLLPGARRDTEFALGGTR